MPHMSSNRQGGQLSVYADVAMSVQLQLLLLQAAAERPKRWEKKTPVVECTYGRSARYMTRSQ